MGPLSKSENAAMPETEPATPRHNNKKIQLNFGKLSKETISAMASDTLRAGGCVEPPPSEPKIGDKMADGTVFAGISPVTNNPIYATPADASLTMTFNEAQEYAAKLDAHGHKDWRVPTRAELDALFNSRAAIGGFNVTGSKPAGWYWSSSEYDLWIGWGQLFSDGSQRNGSKGYRSAVRCIR